MNRFKKYLTGNSQQVAIGVLAFLLLAGVVQAALGLSYVIKVTPIILTAATCAALIFWDSPVRAKLWASSIIFLGSFFIELIGVHTGLLFGNYSYSKLLGFTIFGVPITIGVTWLLVSLSTWHIVLLSTKSILQRLLLGGTLAVMFDLVLEQFAASYGLWIWQAGTIPLYNYVCWFIISILWFGILHKLTPKTTPSLYIVCIMPLMAVFFWLMLLLA
jgi:putative membrane protein